MPLASLKALYFDELADLYDAETQLIRTLPRKSRPSTPWVKQMDHRPSGGLRS